TVRKILFHCPACCEKVDKRGWNLLHFVAFSGNPLQLFLSFFAIGDAELEYGSLKNLMDWKDTHGITPQQVYDAYRGVESSENNQRKKVHLIVFLYSYGYEVAEKAINPVPSSTNDRKDLKKTRDTHLVVAALVATVTFAAAITVPGSFKGEKELDQGTPILIHDAAFKAFVVTDALAFGLSVYTLILHFGMVSTLFSRSRDKIFDMMLAEAVLGYATYGMVLAFSTASYAILKPSLGLAITSSFLGFSFLFFSLIEKKMISSLKPWLEMNRHPDSSFREILTIFGFVLKNPLALDKK
ncbi:hypothetical protein Golob_024726, partial [Gossypium lobatum]|nr:hypothetical protein [Gossypium lobatum]